MKPVSVIIVGAGGRGFVYANIAKKHPELLKVVGVAESRTYHRRKMAREHGIRADHVFRSWQAFARHPKFDDIDAAFICIQDAMHEKCAVALSKLGYHILLEKPMAPSAKACQRIVDAMRASGKMFSVCHVLRYTEYTETVKKLVDSGIIGEIVNIDHHEPVGWWHQAHAYVRGSWRNEKDSSFMLLAKACHDVDWLSFIVGKPCRRVSSFGSLSFFNKAHQPAGAADRCLDCKLSKKCPWSAKEFYFKRLADPKQHGWPLDVVDPTFTKKNLTKALREGPYGRCVFACDNDVVDHQVVDFEYEGGVTASFTMTAFTPMGGRRTRIFGTKGTIETDDSSTIRIFDFLTGKTETIDTNASGASMAGGHGGGDGGIMDAFCTAILENRPELIVSGVDATIESHLATFAAERSRKTGRTVNA